ncbi:MAG: flagellar hook-associated protein FlgK [Roseburia sp.]|nr:flagellar hook-associated protein FlgK [Ruminococcus sp.]MCM1154697.1 flagellar hook-associated protein FlgK [Roseburia sp.]MCM1242127.1 flagellar hook-associated protein FlgK [Roseburia sp.]
MPSTFFGLTIASSGLRAANAALNTTGNNISNVNTEGYSRQVVDTEAANALRVFAKYGCAGAGVETIAIERIRDEFYDNKYRENETRLGEFDTKAYYMRMVENYLVDDKITGFKTIFNGISGALEEVTKNGSSTSVKAQFISSVKTLTDYFNNMYGNFQNLQADVNDEIKMRTDKINSLAQELATVNKQISVIELTGVVANELRDKRGVMLDELSAIVDVKTQEIPVMDQAGNETGSYRFVVRIAGGQTLVDHDDYRQLECIARETEEKVNQSDVDGLYDIMWSDGIEFGLYNDSMGGELRGLIQMRDGNNGEYFNGTVDQIYYSRETTKVTVNTTAAYLDDMAKCKLSDTGGKINIGSQIYYYTDWTYDGDGNYTFTVDNLKSDKPLLVGNQGKEVMIGSEVKYQGVPYYMEQMNEWLRDFSRKVNAIFTEGVTAEGEDAGILFTADYLVSNGQYKEAELNDSRRNGKGYYYMTAGNVAVAEELIKDASLLGSRSSAANGVEECEQVKKMISLMSDKTQFTFRGRDAGGFLECVLDDAALGAENAETFYSTYLSLETSIDNQRTSISGVDEDEEAVSLVKYQNSYTLASKMISTLTEIYDRLILQTGV